MLCAKFNTTEIWICLSQFIFSYFGRKQISKTEKVGLPNLFSTKGLANLYEKMAHHNNKITQKYIWMWTADSAISMGYGLMVTLTLKLLLLHDICQWDNQLSIIKLKIPLRNILRHLRKFAFLVTKHSRGQEILECLEARRYWSVYCPPPLPSPIKKVQRFHLFTLSPPEHVMCHVPSHSEWNNKVLKMLK